MSMNLGILYQRIGLLAAIGMLALTFPTASKAEVTIRWTNYLPPTHPLLNRALKPWFEDVAKATEGRVKVDLLAAPLGPPSRQYDLVIDGVAGGTFSLHGFTPGRFRLMELVELPFIGDKSEVISVAYWRTYKKFIEKSGTHKRAVMVGVSTTSSSNIWNTEKPITTIDDFKGLKMMSAGGISKSVSSALGGVVVATPPPKWYEVLSRGITEATLLPVGAPNTFKLNRFLKHLTLVPGGLANNSFYVVINQSQWDSISAADKKAIEPLLGESLSLRMGKVWDFIDVFGRKNFEKNNVTTTPASPAFVSQLQERLEPFEAEWVKFANSKGVDGQAAIDYLRAQVKALEGK